MPRLSDADRLVLVLGAGALTSNLAGRALDPMAGVLAAEFSTTAATVALLGTAFALPYALIQPVLGPVGDAAGKFRVIRACLGLLALALAASAFAPDLGSLSVLRVLGGVAAGGVFPLAIAVIGDRIPLADRQVALSRLLVAGLTGQAMGGVLAGLLEPWLGWRGVILLCAAVAAGAVLALRSAPAEPPAQRPRLTEALVRYRGLLAMPAARRLYVSVFIYGALVFGVFPFLAPLFAARGQAASVGGVAEAGFAVAAFAAGGFVFGAVTRQLLGALGQARLVLLGGGLSAAGLAVLALAPAAWVAVAGCFGLGLGFYMIHTSVQTRVTEIAPAARGSAVALHAFSFFLGQSLGPVAMGAARALFGPDAALLAAGAGLLALAVWLAATGPKPAAPPIR